MPKEEDEKQIIETVDEEGNIVKFELFDIIEFEKQEYALLLPVEKEDGEDADEIVLMKLQKDGDDYIFEAIEDDAEFDKVSKYIEEFENSEDEDDEDEEN